MINSENEWVLAPAYDLLNVSIANPGDDEEIALTLNGKKRKLKPEHFLTFAKGLGLNGKQIKNIYKRFHNKKEVVYWWLDNSFLSDEYINAYKSVLESRFMILEI